MKDRDISSWISIGSIAPRLCWPSGTSAVLPYVRQKLLEVQEPHVVGVLLDERAPGIDVVALQPGDDVVGDRRVFHLDLEQRPVARVHRGGPQLVVVHLAEALEPADLRLAPLVLGEEGVQGVIVLQVGLLLPEDGRVQRRLGDVDVAHLHQVGHLPVEERQQQRPDVGAVDVGVGEQDDLVVPGVVEVELVGDARPDGGDQRLDLLVLQHPVDPGPLDVEDLPPDRQDRLELPVPRLLGRAAGGVALDDEQLRLAGIARGAVGQLARHRRRLQQRLAPGQVAGLAGGHPGPGGLGHLRHDLLRLGGVLLEPVPQAGVGRLLHQRAHVGVAELRLRLALELRVAEIDRDDGAQALPDVFSGEGVVLLLEEALLPGVLVHDVGEGLAEALLVHAALGRGDVVGEAVEPLVIAGVPLHGHFDLGAVLRVVEVDDPLVERLLGGVEVLDEVLDAAGVLVGHLERRVAPLVAEDDLEALGEERHLPQPLEERLGPELGLLEDRRVGPEGHRRTLLAGAGDALERPFGPAAVDEGLDEPPAVAVDLELEAGGEGVDDRHADAVQAARDLVALAAELAAGMEGREHDLGRRDPRVLGVLVDGNAPAVVDHPAAAVLQEGDLDPVGMAGHGLIDGVVDDLVDQVVEARGTGRSDVHPGAFPDRFQALEDRDVLGVVRHARTFRSKAGCGASARGKPLVRAPKSNVVILPEEGLRSAPKKDVPAASDRVFRRFATGRDGSLLSLTSPRGHSSGSIGSRAHPTVRVTAVPRPLRSDTITYLVPAGSTPASSAAAVSSCPRTLQSAPTNVAARLWRPRRSLPDTFTGAPAPGAVAGSSKTQASRPWVADGPQLPGALLRVVSPRPSGPSRSGARSWPRAVYGAGAGGGATDGADAPGAGPPGEDGPDPEDEPPDGGTATGSVPSRRSTIGAGRAVGGDPPAEPAGVAAGAPGTGTAASTAGAAGGTGAGAGPGAD